MAYHQYSAWSHNYAYEHDGGNDILVTDHNHICVNIKISRRVYFQQNWNVCSKSSELIRFPTLNKFFYQQINRFTHALLHNVYILCSIVPCIK